MTTAARRLALTASLMALTGCASQLGLGRARTLDAGRSRVGGAFQADVVAMQRKEDQSVPLPWTQLTVAARHGVTDRVELGGRLSGFTIPNVLTTWGGAADLKVGVLRPEPGRGRFHLATGLSLQYQQPRLGGHPYHVVGATLPVLVGFAFGRHELVLGPRVADYVWMGDGQNTVNAFYAGSSIGFAAAIGKSFELFPEAVAMYSPLSLNGEQPEDKSGVWLLQAGLGGSFQVQ